MKTAVLFVGMPGSGKSLGAQCANNLRIPILIMGDVVREEAKRRNLPNTPATLSQIMFELREEFGPSIIADRCIDQFPHLDSSCVVIDGVRSGAEVTRFREVIENVTVVAVHAAPQIRFQRLLHRARTDDAVTWTEFEKRDLRELEVGIGQVIAQADFMLVNEGEPEDLKTKILEILKEQCDLD